MAKPTLADLIDLTKEIIIPFYQVNRDVPLRFSPDRFEDDAQHSWSTALLATALAPHVDPTLDTGKVCQFAVIHDLVEVYAGDVSNFESVEKKVSKREREKAAQRKLEQRLTALPWITGTIAAYEAQILPEARFVKAVDKLLPMLFEYNEEGLFYREHKITAAAWQEHMQTQRQKAATHPGAFAYYDELWNLLLAHPHFFHRGQPEAN